MIGRRPLLRLVPALALVLGGCDAVTWDYDEDGDRLEPEYDYVSICTDRNGNRVDDGRCPVGDSDNGSGFVWFYMPTSGGVTAPPVGHRIDRSTGVYRPPTTLPGGKVPSVARGGSVPAGGGVVQRGGFGVSGGKSGGSGS